MLRGRTLWELLDRRVDATPDALMAVDEDMRTITFGEYWAESERAAAGLLNHGVEPGSVVSWQLPTWIESLVLVGALSRIGAIQNPISPIFHEREVGFITNQAGSALLIVPSVWRDFNFEEMGRSISTAGGGAMRVLVSDRALPQGDPSILPPISEALDPADQPVRWLFYTAGTTADPKGVQHTDASIAVVARGMAERIGVIQADRNALAFPFTHISGITWLFTSLQTGCSNILMDSFHPEATPEVLSREKVTLAGSATVFHQAYLAYQRKHPMPVFPDLRALLGGGSSKPPSIVAEVREAFSAPILSGYGLTEAPVLTMADLSDTDEELAASEGKPMPGVELRFVTPEGKMAEPGQEGEIRAKAPQIMRGYLDPKLNSDVFDEDGFFRTGDLGRLDDRGNVIITGRVKDVIMRKGENVAEEEMEDLLNTRPVVDLRPLGDGDLGAVLALNQHWVPHVGSLDEQSLGSLLAEATLALGAWSSSGELAGLVIALSDGADYSSPNYRYFSQRHDTFTYVDRIAVSPSAQGQGVGRSLYDAVAAQARGSGSTVVCAEVNVEPPNPESQVFHSNYGFVEVGRQWTYGDTVEVQLLELALP